MNWKLWFKAGSLVIALSATVFSIYLLNSQHSVDFLSSLGFSSSQKTLNWCSDRLRKAEGLSQPWSLEEKNGQWMLQTSSSQEFVVDYLEVEKWLAKYCSVHITPYPPEKILDLKLSPFARIQFGDKSTALIYQKDFSVFQINEITFESKEMQEGLFAIKNLLKIPN
ncbi:hypothetical protein K2X05_10880 [bacterium]|nr:hypothetical protein [bacterium]